MQARRVQNMARLVPFEVLGQCLTSRMLKKFKKRFSLHHFDAFLQRKALRSDSKEKNKEKQ